MKINESQPNSSQMTAKGNISKAVEENPIPRLLAITESAAMHDLLKSELQTEWVEFHGTTISIDGFLKAKTIKPEVILLNIETDEIDGLKLLSRLKEDSETKNIAVMFIGSSRKTVDIVKTLDMGAMDFIFKPFDASELRARVRAALRIQGRVKLLEERAQLDSHTRLKNRGYFDERMIQAISQFKRDGQPLSLVLCDIDRFKRVNTRFGHIFGDEVLLGVAQTLSSGRAMDIACRIGGEEFALILPSTSIQFAIEVAERLRNDIQLKTWPQNKNFNITASFGVCDTANFNEEITPQALLGAADKLLHRAKKLGRNRVEPSN